MPKHGLSVTVWAFCDSYRKVREIWIGFCPYAGKYGSEKARIWAYFMQCCCGVSTANFEQVFPAWTLFLPFVAAVYYKIWKKERKVISLTYCKLKCFFSRI